MGELNFTLELTSPAFLNGVASAKKGTVQSLGQRGWDGTRVERCDQPPFYPAEPGGVRIPSLRGILEFWLRSLYGSNSVEEIFAAQERVFGSTQRGQGIRFRPSGCSGLKPGALEFLSDPYGKVYLGYGPLQLLRRPDPSRADGVEIATSFNRIACREALLIDPLVPTRFSFLARGSEAALQALRAALTLLHLFGGVGARSRRGWGSVRVIGDFIPTQGRDEDLSIWFSRVLSGVWAFSGTPLPSRVKSEPRHSAFSSKTQIRLIGPLQGDYAMVLDRFYQRFKEVRLWRGPGGGTAQLARDDHDLEREAVDGGLGAPLAKVPRRLAFGLPYQPKFRDNQSISYFGEAVPLGQTPKPREIHRRASPLFLKVVRLGPNSHAGVVLFLRASFFGTSNYEVAATGRAGTQRFPGYSAIADFVGTDSQLWRAIRLP